MKTSTRRNINIFANEFVSNFIEGNDQKDSDYRWEIAYDCMVDEIGQLITNTSLSLYFEDEEDSAIIGVINYEMIRNNKMKYMYQVTCDFGDGDVTNEDDEEAFMEIADRINHISNGLFDKICAYMHQYMQENGEDSTCECPSSYEEYYSPFKVKNFMKKYSISPYVPIDIEVVDDKGLPIEYLNIKEIAYDDEANRLIVMLKK